MLLYDVVSRAYNCVSQFEFKWRLIYHTACDITRYPIHNDWWHDEDAINHHKAHALEILRHTHPYIQPNILTIIQVDIQIYNPAYQGSVFAFWDRELVLEQVFASLREQQCCSRNPLVRELIHEPFVNKPSLLCLGIFTKLAFFGGSFEKIPVF